MRTLLLAVAVSSLSMLSSAARADTFNFTATALGTTVSGMLTATSNNDGSYLITGINATGITGLIGPNDPFFGNDNLLIPANTRSLDVNGLAYSQTIAGQPYSVNLFSSPAGFQYLALDSSSNLYNDVATFSVNGPLAPTPAPEPSSLVLLMTGLLSAGTLVFLRRRSSMPVVAA